MMLQVNNITSNIVERLKYLNPHKIILYGSFAYGNPDKYSDIDLLVVLNNDEMPKTFEEKINHKIAVRNCILDINKKISIDLMVFTKPMYNRFIELDSMFSKEILLKGKVIYETNN